MPIAHVRLPQQTILLRLPEGSHYITPYTYNYYKIMANFSTLTLDQLRSLLVTPDFPNGVFYFYVEDNNPYITNNGLIYSFNKETTNLADATFKGIYTSIDEIKSEFPEYFI